ncbi:MAG: hypothetical protein JSU98_01865 [Gemmatimonadales bacterium]|jgi:hypothetical protein|nr:MAG: hypothetical protein JSU98_01865 [Gemmatimonadales bacterium]
MSITDRLSVRLLLEGVVILTSILIAFLLEGWRADRELARELAQELTSVQAELERNRDLVTVERVALRRVLDGGDSLLHQLRSADGPYVEVVDTLAWLGTGWSVSFSPSLGAVDALIASGRLAQVSNSELRLLLAGLRDMIADAFEEEEGARGISTTQVAPLVGAHLDLNTLFEIGRRFFASDEDTQGMTPQERVRTRALVSSGTVSFPADVSVRSAVGHRLGWLSTAYSEFGSLERHLERMIELVADERRSLPRNPVGS